MEKSSTRSLLPNLIMANSKSLPTREGEGYHALLLYFISSNCCSCNIRGMQKWVDSIWITQSAHFCMLELPDGHDWLASLELIGKRVCQPSLPESTANLVDSQARMAVALLGFMLTNPGRLGEILCCTTREPYLLNTL